MSFGEVIKKKFILIAENPDGAISSVSLSANAFQQCCFCLPVFGVIGGSDDLKNDRSGFLWILNNGIVSAVMKLQKNESGVWVDKDTFSDDTYGTFFDFGFYTQDNNNYIGYQLQWELVLDAFSHGTYRVKLEYVDIQANDLVQTSFVYKLKPYNDIDAENTVRIEFYNNNIIGNWENYTQKKDFAQLNWYNAIRFPNSEFGFEDSEYDSEQIRFNSGRLVDVRDDQTPKYILDLGGIPYWLHRYTKSEILQSDMIFATDYNSSNQSGEFVELPVKKAGSYEPTGKGGTNPLTPVAIEMKLAVNNLRKKFC